MRKEEFFAVLDEGFKGRDFEEITDMLKLIIDSEWMKEYASRYAEEHLKKLHYCCKCHRFSLLKDFTSEIVEEERLDYYHDDELLAQKTIEYLICPKCNERCSERVLKQKVIKWL